MPGATFMDVALVVCAVRAGVTVLGERIRGQDHRHSQLQVWQMGRWTLSALVHTSDLALVP